MGSLEGRMGKIFDESQVIGITCKTLNTLFEKGSPDSVVLYLKYAYHAKHQKTNQIWATDSFMAQGIGWSVRKIKKEKKVLKDLGFLSIIPYKNPKTHRVEKWFCKVEKLITSSKTKAIFEAKNDTVGVIEGEVQSAPVCPIQSARIPPSGNGAPKCLNYDNKKCLNYDNFAEAEKPIHTLTHGEEAEAHPTAILNNRLFETISLTDKDYQKLKEHPNFSQATNEEILESLENAKDKYFKGRVPEDKKDLVAKATYLFRNKPTYINKKTQRVVKAEDLKKVVNSDSPRKYATADEIRKELEVNKT